MLALYYLMKKSKCATRVRTDDYYKNLNTNVFINNKDDLNTRCRVCLQEGSFPIYGNDETVFILETIQAVGNVQIDENDEFPKHLCDVCHEFIRNITQFRKVVQQSDEFLKKPVKQESMYDQDFSDSSFYDKHVEEWTSEENSEIKKEKKVKVKYASKVTCNICNKVINKSYYKEHMTMHDPDHQKYVCDVCGKSFRLRCAYHNHSLRHRNDFQFKCQFCPYKARYSELLKTHMRTHTGDYRYMCTECPARFLFKSNLNSHMHKHKDPQFKCQACNKGFHSRLMLKRHFEADHLGIKNHVCNLCGKAFGYRNAMMKHQRHVHKREKLLFGRMPAYLEAEHRSEDQQ
ncbi:uncharacterized protein LOC142983515 [Anticarsia gemmatalis]|uniref:uncharacterized protein LOC142983515 n=1 Tax=Anticarsia gemmatalis TaxID=129554 RepID=UPI003F76F47C